MRRRVFLVVLVVGWLTALYAGDFTMPGSRGRIRPPVVKQPFFARGAPSGLTKYSAGYAAGLLTSGTKVNVTLNQDSLYTLPFVMSRRATVTGLHADMSPGAPGAVCKFGIYDTKSETEIIPQNLLYSSPVLAADVLSTLDDAPSFGMRPDILYWIGLVCGNAAPPQLSGFNNTSAWAWSGMKSDGQDIPNAYRPLTNFSANGNVLPNPFPQATGCPTCAPINLAFVPALVVRFGN